MLHTPTQTGYKASYCLHDQQQPDLWKHETTDYKTVRILHH